MYTVKFYKGDYLQRQLAANKDKAIAYVEHHFNSSASAQANYAVVVVGSNASNTSRNWGRWYAKAVAEQFGTQVAGDQGILLGGWNGRGDGNVKHTAMPALLLEPLFASNPQQAEIIRSDSGQDTLWRASWPRASAASSRRADWSPSASATSTRPARPRTAARRWPGAAPKPTMPRRC